LSLEVHVRPRAGRSAIVGKRPDGSLEVAVRAAPEHGAANTEVIALLARAFGVAQSAVRLRRGAAARRKLFSIEGASAEAIASLAFSPGRRLPSPRKAL
jgi:uncharacterized protein (TIGR00251 family)